MKNNLDAAVRNLLFEELNSYPGGKIGWGLGGS